MTTYPTGVAAATILVVDDDALITLNTVDVLNERGFTALEAFSGAEALAMVERFPDIAAIVTDYAMPGMNGQELAEAARRLRPGLPVLLTSGYSELPHLGDKDLTWLEKPYREDQLVARLTDLLAPAGD